jgi:hypothetical protein
MADKHIRIIPKLREPDLDKLAEALLDLVDSLTPEERDHFAAIGEQVLEQVEGGSKPKGRAG